MSKITMHFSRITIFFFILSSLFAEPPVTIKEYATYLNSVAASDPHHFYDLKMSGEDNNGILRLGTPGNYFYKAIEENESISYIDASSAMDYVNWENSFEELLPIGKKTTRFSLEYQNGSTDFLLKINRVHFILPDNSETQEASSHAMIALGLEEEIEEIIGIGTVLGGVEATRRTIPDKREELIDQAEPSGLHHGGLTNNRADCFINSSLQLCKAFHEELDSSSLIKMPYLARFLSVGLRSDIECRFLREEMANHIIKGNQDLQGAIQEGTAQTHQDAAAFLRLFLEKTKAPKIFFEERLENRANNAIRIDNSLPGEQLLQIALPTDDGTAIRMQDLVNNSLTSIRQQRWSDDASTAEVQSSLKLKEPIPAMLIISIGRFGYDAYGVKNQRTISGFKDTICIPTVEGKETRYEPTAIICHQGNSLNEGHYFTHRKENGIWTVFNDEQIVVSRLQEGGTASRNCYVISYKKIDAKDHLVQSPIVNKTPLNAKTKELYRLGWSIVLHNFLDKAEESLKALQCESAAAAYYKDGLVSTAWNSILSDAWRVKRYIENCKSDHDKNCLSPYGLAALDRAEETLRLRIKAVKLHYYLGDYSDYPYVRFASVFEDESKYLVNALLGERAGNQFLVKSWAQAAQDATPQTQVALRDPIEIDPYRRSYVKIVNDQLMQARNYTTNAVEARIRGDEEIAYYWDQAAKQARNASAACILQGQAAAMNKRKKASGLQDVFRFKYSTADQFVNIAYYSKLVQDARNAENEELAHLFAWIVRCLQIVTECRVDVNQYNNSSNSKGPHDLKKSAYSCVLLLSKHAHDAAKLLTSLTHYKTEANKACQQGNNQAAVLWHQAIRQIEDAIEDTIQIALRRLNQKQSDFLFHTVRIAEGTSQRLCHLAREASGSIPNFGRIDAAKIVDYRQQAEQAQKQGYSILADLWTKVSSDMENFYHYISTTKNHGEVEQLRYAAMAAEAEATHLARVAKTIDQPRFLFEEDDKIIVARGVENWKEVQRLEKGAILSQLAAKRSLPLDLPRASTSLSPHGINKFAALAKAAREAGNQEQANCWSEVVRLLQLRYQEQGENHEVSNQFALVYPGASFSLAVRKAKAQALGDPQIIDLVAEVEKLDQALSSKQAAAECSNTHEISDNSTNCSIDHAKRRVRSAEYYIDQVIEARIVRSQKEADLWIQALRQMKDATEKEMKVIELKLAKNNKIRSLEEMVRPVISSAHERLIHFGEAATTHLAYAVDYAVKAAQARSFNDDELIMLWSQAGEQQQLAGKKTVEAASYWLVGNKTEANRLQDAAQDARATANKYVESAKVKTNKIGLLAHYTTQAVKSRAAGNKERADRWERAMEHLKKAWSHETQALEAQTSNDSAEEKSFKEASVIAKRLAQKEAAVADYFYSEVEDYLTKAKQAQKQGNSALANLWKQAAGQMEVAGKMYVRPNPEDTTSFSSILKGAERLKRIANYATNAFKASAVKNYEMAYLWIQEAELLKVAACEREAQNQHNTVSDILSTIRFTSGTFRKAIDCRVHAAQAKMSKKEKIADQWIQAAIQWQLNAEYGMKAIQSKKNKDEIEYSLWDQAIYAGEAAAKSRVRLAEYYQDWDGESERPDAFTQQQINREATLARQNQVKAERFVKAIYSKIEGNQRASALWIQAANQKDFSNLDNEIPHDEVASKFINAIGHALAREAEASDRAKQCNVQKLNETEIGSSVEDIVSLFMKGVVCHDKAIACKLADKKEEADLWDKAASAFKREAKSRARMEGNDQIQHVSRSNLGDTFFIAAPHLYVIAAENLSAGNKELAERLAHAADQGQIAHEQKKSQ